MTPNSVASRGRRLDPPGCPASATLLFTRSSIHPFSADRTLTPVPPPTSFLYPCAIRVGVPSAAAYDPVGNLTNIHYPASGTIQFTYDAMNRLATMVDGLGTTAYGYTQGGQLWTEDRPFASDTVSNTYSNRERTALALQQPAGLWTNGFGWDAARRLRSVTSPAGGFTYTYTGVGQAASPARLVQELALPNGAYVTNTFDSVARLLVTRLNHSGGSALDGYAYVYAERGSPIATFICFERSCAEPSVSLLTACPRGHLLCSGIDGAPSTLASGRFFRGQRYGAENAANRLCSRF